MSLKFIAFAYDYISGVLVGDLFERKTQKMYRLNDLSPGSAFPFFLIFILSFFFRLNITAITELLSVGTASKSYQELCSQDF